MLHLVTRERESRKTADAYFQGVVESQIRGWKNDDHFELKMATISRRKIYDIPEEVGMDIVEAIDMLEIITLKGKSSAFSDKIYFEIMKICFFTSMIFFPQTRKYQK